MKKNLLFIVIACFLFHEQASCQVFAENSNLRGLLNFSRSYFRPDPFRKQFSTFLNLLLNDPLIENKILHKRSDTSLFYFSGTYKDYNPFFFKPKETKILLQEQVVELSTESKKTDTIFTYQLITVTDNTSEMLRDIEKEFNKMHRQNKGKFYNTNHEELKEDGKYTFTINHYFVYNCALSPLTIGWGKVEGESEAELALTLRFRMEGNEAVLINCIW